MATMIMMSCRCRRQPSCLSSRNALLLKNRCQSFKITSKTPKYRPLCLVMTGQSRFTELMKEDAEEQKPLVGIVARLVAQLVDQNDTLPADKEITVFHAQKAPAVCVADYADRIAKYSSCSSCCFVVGMMYVDRFIIQQRAKRLDFRMNSLNVHRLMLSSIMVAAKFLDDFYYSNEFWAKIGGVPNAELNTLELEFLFLTNFDLQVKRDMYNKYRAALIDWDVDNSNNYLGIGDGLKTSQVAKGMSLGYVGMLQVKGKLHTHPEIVDVDTGDEGANGLHGMEATDTPPPSQMEDIQRANGANTEEDGMAIDD